MDIFSIIINIGIHAHFEKNVPRKAYLSLQIPCGKFRKFRLFSRRSENSDSVLQWWSIRKYIKIEAYINNQYNYLRNNIHKYFYSKNSDFLLENL